MYPPKILGVEILHNPFDDIVPRKKKEPVQKAPPVAPVVSKPKATKLFYIFATIFLKILRDFALLSFGDEAENDEQEFTAAGIKIKSEYEFDTDLKQSVSMDDVKENPEAYYIREEVGISILVK